MNPTTYDSAPDTLAHIRRVQELLAGMQMELAKRAIHHDTSKLESPEKEGFDEYTPKLKALTYGSDEYKECLTQLGVCLKHHYGANTHHPEHFENGIKGMNLLDVLEMVCDWKAATERHADGDIAKSVQINSERFQMGEVLTEIIDNTRRDFGW